MRFCKDCKFLLRKLKTDDECGHPNAVICSEGPDLVTGLARPTVRHLAKSMRYNSALQGLCGRTGWLFESRLGASE